MAEEIGARQGLDGQSRRHGGGDGIEQLGGVRDAGAGVDGGVAALLPTPVEHGEAGVEGGAAARVGTPVDRCGEQHTSGRVEGCEGVGPGGIAGSTVGRGDGHQPPARRQHREGGADVAQVGVMADTVHAGARREGWVHKHHGGMQGREVVPDGLGVVAREGGAGKQAGEQPRAGGGDLVEVERPVGLRPEGALGHDGEHAGACRRFEHDIAGTDGGGLQGRVGERERRRELLVLELLFGAACLGGLQGGEGLHHAEHGGGSIGTGTGLAPHGAAVALEEEDQGRLGRFVGVLPEPGALGVAGTEGAGHRLAQRGSIERAAGLQNRQQGMGGSQQGGGFGTGLRSQGGGLGGGGRRDGGGRARGRGRRRMGVEHGAGSNDEGARRPRRKRFATTSREPLRPAGPGRQPLPLRPKPLLGEGLCGGGAAALCGAGAAGVDQALILGEIEVGVCVRQEGELGDHQPDRRVGTLIGTLGNCLAAGIVDGQSYAAGIAGAGVDDEQGFAVAVVALGKVGEAHRPALRTGATRPSTMSASAPHAEPQSRRLRETSDQAPIGVS